MRRSATLALGALLAPALLVAACGGRSGLEAYVLVHGSADHGGVLCCRD